jgi:flagellar hook protein FlgE
MIRSMSSAISGMKNHQLMLDVISNDISNVSTSGFKASNVVFSDVLSQTLTAGDPNGVVAGTNPSQVGLGARLAATTQSFSQGALQRTGRSTDMAIEGEGFFVVSLDASGNLATSDGNFVMGWQANATGAVDTTGQVSRISVPVGSALAPSQTANVQLAGNLSAAAAVGTVVTNSMTGYTAQGATVQLNLTYTKSAANEWTVTGSHGSPGTAVTLTDNVLTFGTNGEITAPVDRTINVAAGQIPGITDAVTFNLGAAGAVNRVTQFGSTSTVGIVSQDGSLAGSLQSFAVSAGGAIQGVYSNGKTMTVGQVAMALFTNPQGLERVSGGWRETGNSGVAQVSPASTGGRGKISAGTLEMSNVDLAEEFSRLIVAQRGFQGNARVISASDEILQEVVRIGR